MALVVNRGNVSEGGLMDEHDDDLESEVVEGAQKETDSFPATSDELEGTVSERPDPEEDSPPLDDDAAEL